MTDLQVQRDALLALSQRCKSFIPAIRALPADTLCSIFQLCVDDAENRAFRAAHTLASVCRQWRSLALASPLLWARIFVKSTPTVQKTTSLRPGGDDWQVLDMLVKRTLGVPLSIDIDFTSDISLASVATVGQSASRWRALTLKHYASQAQADITALGALNSCNILEELDVTLRRDIKGEIGGILEAFSQCPRLESLCLADGCMFGPGYSNDVSDADESTRRPSINWTVNKCHFPLHQLTTLTLNINIRTEEVLDILRITTRLKSLEVYNDYTRLSWHPEPDYDPIVLSELTSLSCTHVHGFLLVIQCPAVETLEIFEANTGSFLSFITNSRLPLRTLRIYAYAEDWKDLDPSPIIGTIPRLELGVDADEMDILCIPPSASQGVPILAAKHISLIVQKPIDKLCNNTRSVNSILAFVKAYWQNPRRELKSFHLLTQPEKNTQTCCSDYRSEEFVRSTPFYQAMEKFRKEGLEVLISWSSSSGMRSLVILRVAQFSTIALQILNA
ncbi:hypothetical protein CYLTODRAFT_443067 [Cylindrobasidium torrendii FP15055 ss-10]|uniref:F-box domain-containing protein n=1 Tax=Cylindrobasidium torrendii FP15055 ss-10 TaxID=1314674 RepID=A0A0D7BGY8_9AGAR|nr:hypothetical protein CYLTODRAFT_443067 [Cylindrobasidium torrendii FP15055 ss-10]